MVVSKGFPMVNPLSVMSKLGPNFKLGDQDEIINSFNKNGEFKYAMVPVRDMCYNIVALYIVAAISLYNKSSVLSRTSPNRWCLWSQF